MFSSYTWPSYPKFSANLTYDAISNLSLAQIKQLVHKYYDMKQDAFNFKSCVKNSKDFKEYRTNYKPRLDLSSVIIKDFDLSHLGFN